MASPPAPGPQLSPDGNYWWDGQAWQLVQRAPAPAVPVAVPTPAPAPAAPARPDWLDQAPAWLESPPAAAESPLPPEPVAYEAAPAPPWVQPPKSASRPLMFITGALLIGVIAIGGLVVRGELLAGNDQPLAAVTPSPLLPDYERADRFLNVDLGPSLTEAVNALPPVEKNCTSSLPPPCKDALVTLDTAMVDVEDAMRRYQGDIPNCIGPPVAQFRVDWNGMEQGVAQAISGYQNNSRDLIIVGLQKFASLAQFVKPDVDRINAAKATCPKT